MTSDDDDGKGKGSAPGGISRRAFLSSTGLGVAAAGLLRAREAQAAGSVKPPTVVGPGRVAITMKVNGVVRRLEVEPRTTLAEALRVELGLTGTKIGCDRGACSACTVHLDGKAVTSCLVLALDVRDRAVTTIEGLAKGEALHPVQQEFIAHDALQCGYCTPGMVMASAALLASKPRPSLDEVKGAVCGNLCRCGTYPKVFAAVMAASGQALPEGSAVQTGAALLRSDAPAAPPTDEPPRWPTPDGLAVIGKPTPRLDGRAKVTGAAKFTADVQLPGMLWARRVVAPWAHARVRSIDTSAAERLPGVKAVHVVERNREGAQLVNPPSSPDRWPTIRYAGQTVAAVAATSAAIAAEAARLVRVEYEKLPFVVDPDEARRDDAPLVFPGPVEMAGSAGGGGAAKALPQRGNVRGPSVKERGDVAAGLRAAALSVSGEFHTQAQTHSAMEPHGVVADWRPDGLTVYASTQGTATVRDELAAVFDLPKSKVRVITDFMGGGFGAKFGAGMYGVLATHLSKKSGKPVRLVLDRKEEHHHGSRPSTVQEVTLGATRDGALTAVSLRSFGSAGIATGAGVGNVAEVLYPAPAFRGEQSDVFTHVAPSTAFRAPGAPQGVFAVEQLVDELAERLKLDPLALRDRLDAGDARADREARRRERAIGAEAFGWAKRRRPPASDRGPIKRGVGVAQSIWPRIVDLDAACEVRVTRDGSIELSSSVQDIGTGTRTALAMVVAEELGVAPSAVTMRIGDTRFPIGPSSGGSKTLTAITPPARTAAYRVKQQLFAAVAPALGAKPEQLVARDGKIAVRGGGGSLGWKQAAAKMRGEELAARASRLDDYGGNLRDGLGGVQFVEVLVDTETGLVRVERVVAVHDCGRVVNPLAAQSQVNGGVLHGLSWALFEERVLDRQTGRMVNANFDQYKIAGARETPIVQTIFVEQENGRTSTEVSGLGEPANIATAVAIANAVYNAIGVRMRRLPMSPPVVLAALAAAAKRGGGR